MFFFSVVWIWSILVFIYVHLKDFWKGLSTIDMEFVLQKKKYLLPSFFSHPALKHFNIALLQGLPSCPYFSAQGASTLGSDMWHIVKFSQSKNFGVMNE